VLQQIAEMTVKIKQYDRQIQQLSPTTYPETQALLKVHGVGHITVLTYVLTLGNKQRFRRSRDAGCYLGLRPRRSQSGDRDPQLGITKAGNVYLRSLLIECANHILWPQVRTRLFDAGAFIWQLEVASRPRTEHLRVSLISVDLLDPNDVQSKLGPLTDVTHIVFGAYIERPTAREKSEVNVAILHNLLDAVEAASPNLQHVAFYQGGKGLRLRPRSVKDAGARRRSPAGCPPTFTTTRKIFFDTEDMFFGLFDELRRESIIPRLT
jgi:hypothetical protein